jgi:LysM repeat protein
MVKKFFPLIAVVVVIVGLFLVADLIKPGRTRRASSGGAHNPTVSGLTNSAKEYEARGNLQEARALYQKLISDFSGASEVASWQKKVEELNMKLLFSPLITPKSILYEIRPGDSLDKIARLHKTTVDLLVRSNNIADNKIMAGKKIKVWTAPLSILVYKGQNILILKTDDEVLKTYTVSTGANNCTPAGLHVIINKLVHPTWFKSGAVVPAGSPENVLGTRWMGFNTAGFGIHGTTEPHLLGTQVTEGCVRMANQDVEELYSIVPVGTQVQIFE